MTIWLAVVVMMSCIGEMTVELRSALTLRWPIHSRQSVTIYSSTEAFNLVIVYMYETTDSGSCKPWIAWTSYRLEFDLILYYKSFDGLVALSTNEYFSLQHVVSHTRTCGNRLQVPLCKANRLKNDFIKRCLICYNHHPLQCVNANSWCNLYDRIVFESRLTFIKEIGFYRTISCMFCLYPSFNEFCWSFIVYILFVFIQYIDIYVVHICWTCHSQLVFHMSHSVLGLLQPVLALVLMCRLATNKHT